MKKVWHSLKPWILKATLFFFVSSVALVLLYRVVPVPLTPLMVFRSVSSLWEDSFIGLDKTWVPLEEISPSVQKAILKAEDVRFFEHYGFDLEAIEKAIKYNKKHKSKKGASTISQQTAKNVFLWPNRDWVRKGLEAYFTVLIEATWPKSRILEVYLNVIELGPGVYGVEAAAQKYFHRSARNLNSRQASLIAAVLPNPLRFRIDRPSRYVVGRQRRILGRAAPMIPKVTEASFLDFFNVKIGSDDEAE